MVCWAKDRVLLTTDAEGMKVYKIITRQTRRPEVGPESATASFVSGSAMSCSIVSSRSSARAWPRSR